MDKVPGETSSWMGEKENMCEKHFKAKKTLVIYSIIFKT